MLCALKSYASHAAVNNFTPIVETWYDWMGPTVSSSHKGEGAQMGPYSSWSEFSTVDLQSSKVQW